MQTKVLDNTDDIRLKYEKRINELDTLVKQRDEHTLQLEAKILELES